MKRRLFSFLLAVVMVFSLASVGFAAEEEYVAFIGEDGYATLAAAVKAAKADDTITMVDDETATGSLTIGKNVTIDFGGNTYTGAVTVSNKAVVVLENGYLEAGAEDTTLLTNNGTVTIAEDMELSNKNSGATTISAAGSSVTNIEGTVIAGTNDVAVSVTSAKAVVNINSENASVTGKLTTDESIDVAKVWNITAGTFTTGCGVKEILDAEWAVAAAADDGVGTKEAETYHAVEGKHTTTIEACEIESINIDDDCTAPVWQLKCSDEDCTYTFSATEEGIPGKHTSGDDLKVYKYNTKTKKYEEVEPEDVTCGDKVYTTYTCEVCEMEIGSEGEAKEIEHEFDEKKHVPANCDTNEHYVWVCSECGEEKEGEDAIVEIPNGEKAWGYTHDYYTTYELPACNDTSKTKTVNVTMVCQICGDVVEQKNVNYVEKTHGPIECDWELIKTEQAPVCGVKGNAGLGLYECTVCGTKKYEAIARENTGDETIYDDEYNTVTEYHVFVEVPASEAACATNATYTLKCEKCGVEVTDATGEPIEFQVEGTMLAHTFAPGTTKATCGVNAVTGLVCTECQVAYSTKNDYEEVSETMLTCDWDYSNIFVEATCKAPGYAFVATCKNCGNRVVAEVEVATTNKAKDIDVQPDTVYFYEGKYVVGGFEIPKLKEHSYETVTVEANCMEGAKRYDECTVCGDKTNEQAVAGSKPLATNHKYEDMVPLKDATCLKPAEVQYTCKYCGDVEKHTYGTWDWETNGKYTVGGSEDENGKHTWDESKTVTHREQTCTVSGKYTKYCTVCEESYTFEVAAVCTKGELISEIAAFPCMDGVKVYACANCDKTITERVDFDEEKETVDHTIESWTPVAGTYAKVGTCTVCGTEFAKYIDNIDDYKDAKALYSCALGVHTTAISSETESDDSELWFAVPADENTTKNWTLVLGKEATCSEAGLEDGQKCEDCGKMAVEQKPIEKTAHTPEVIPAVDATCTETGLTAGEKCTVCDETTVAQETVAALGHSFGEWVETPATVTEAGYETRACKTCGADDAVKTLSYGWEQRGKDWVLRNDEGKLHTGWFMETYYFDEEGVMATYWEEIDGKWYFFNYAGAKWNQTFVDLGDIFMLNDGVLVESGWNQDAEGNYYFANYANGALLVDGTYDINGVEYTFDANGVWVG